MNFLNKKINFEIETLKLENPELTYLDCVLVVCESNNIEIESVKTMLSRIIKEKLEADANKLNLLKNKYNTLI